MSLLSTAAIYFIACHGGPADHFATFSERLRKKGYDIHIYATGPALQKFQERHTPGVVSFSLDNLSEEAAARDLSVRCAEASVIITDVGHPFDIPLQHVLADRVPHALRFAYYDNPESYVPGGYSTVAAKVMLAAEKVLFANANLAEEPIEQTPSQEVPLAFEKRIGIGYYSPVSAEKIRERRSLEQKALRAQFFSGYSLEDQGQKILVYAGGNNAEYFGAALPAFLQFIQEAAQKQDLSSFIVLLQQHPGAKKENLDVALVKEWLAQQGKTANLPLLLVSQFSSDVAQVFADAMLYYQTSMGPQFVLAGIPTMQVGHAVNKDLLVKTGMCSIATNSLEFKEALLQLQSPEPLSFHKDIVLKGVGYRSDWEDRLETAVAK